MMKRRNYVKFLRRKDKKSNYRQILYFKSGAAFFEYQCSFGHTSLSLNTAVPALVLDARQESGQTEAVGTAQDGSQIAALRVAAEDGGFSTVATTPSARGEKLLPGDVVLWVPVAYAQEAAYLLKDKRMGWVGLIRAKIKPEIDLADPLLVVACRYN